MTDLRGLSRLEMLGFAGERSDHGEYVGEFVPALLEALEAATVAGDFLEIGVQNGGSAILTLWHLLHWNGALERIIPPRFFTVDVDSGIDSHAKDSGDYPYRHFQMDQGEFTEKALPVLGSRFAFVYHDGAHGDEPVNRDVGRLAPYMVRGGIIAVDDMDQCSAVPDFSSLGLEQVTYGFPREWTTPSQETLHIGFWRKLGSPDA